MGRIHFKCCIPPCKSKYSEDCGIHFFKLPLDSMKKQSWIEILTQKFPEINIKNNSRICQLHFTDVNFTNTCKNKLSNFAYPDTIVSECSQDSPKQLLQEETTEVTLLPSTSQGIQPLSPQNTYNVEPHTPPPNPESEYLVILMKQ